MKTKSKKVKKLGKTSKKFSVPIDKHRPNVTHLILKSSVFAFLGFTLMLNVVGSNPQLKLQKSEGGEVLAYATNTTISGLLASTNAERTSRGLAPLTLNSQLNSSGQAKANDMVATNYWAHNRPDGTPPWNFFYAAGYTGSNLGENLAYGQLTSQQTVNEWMASQTHRDNILNSNFCEVGFGISNSANFVNNGPQTVVAAHYGRPFGTCPGEAPAPAPTPAPAVTPPAPAPTPPAAPKNSAPKPVTPQIVVSAPDTSAPSPATSPEPVTPSATLTPQAAPSVQTSVPAAPDAGRRATRIELYTKGEAPWLSYVMSIGLITSLGAYALKHAIGIKKTVLKGESWVLHHPTLDALILGIIALTFFLSRTIGGFVK